MEFPIQYLTIRNQMNMFIQLEINTIDYVGWNFILQLKLAIRLMILNSSMINRISHKNNINQSKRKNIENFFRYLG